MTRRLLPLLALALFVGACSARLPSSSPGAPSVSPEGSLDTATPSVVAPTPTPSPTPTGVAVPSGGPDRHAAIARLCTPSPDPGADLVDCTDAIQHALAALGPDAERAAVAWYRDGVACPPNARCVAPPPGTGHVAVLFRDGPVLLVPLQLVDDAYVSEPPTAPTWDVWGPTLVNAGPPEAPDLGPTAPAELQERPPLPFCGTEDDIFNRNVRSCFHESVRANLPAEYITAVAGPDGQAVNTVHRYRPGGTILVYRDRTGDPAVAAWTKEDCAMETVFDGEQIFIDGHCLPLPIG